MPPFGTPNVKKLAAKRDLEGMIKALGYQQDSPVRFDAVQALGRPAEARAVEPLMGALHDRDEDVRDLAANALQAIAGRTSPSPPPG